MKTSDKNQFRDVVLWSGKPLFHPYLFNHILSYKSTIQILLIGLAIALTGSLLYKTKFDWNGFFAFFGILCFAALIQILLKIIGHHNTKYWITKDAVYIQAGVLKPIITLIKKDKILFIDIEKSNAEKKYEAGTLVIDDGETKKGDLEDYKVYKRLIAIRHPEEAVGLFKYRTKSKILNARTVNHKQSSTRFAIH